MKRNLLILSLMLLIVSGLTLVGYAKDKSFTIGIIQYVEHQALDAAREGFIDALKDSGYEAGLNIEIDYQNAQGDASNLSTISDRFVGKKLIWY